MTRETPFAIMPLAARPDVIGPLATLLEATWPDWYGASGQGDADKDLTARSGPGLPKGWVALHGDVAIGTVALTRTSFGAGPEEAPWLGGLCVAPEWRGRGIGGDLVAEVERSVPGPLYTTTREAAPIFQRRGWAVLRDVEDGWQVLRRA